MKWKSLLTVFIWLTGITVNCNGQGWPKVLLPNTGTTSWSIAESYDKGYIVGGMYTNTGAANWGIAIKTDINGNVLWYKSIGQPGDGTAVLDMNQTTEGGYILTGGTRMLHPASIGDTYIQKLDACGNVEWCRIYSTDNQGDYGISIRQVPGGYIALVGGYGDDPQNKVIWLFRLDNSGDLVWQQYYAQSDTAIFGEWAYDFQITNEHQYILSGRCYYPEPGGSLGYERPFIIKVDSTGGVIWELPWTNSQLFVGWINHSAIDNQGNIYSGITHVDFTPPGGYRPCLIKTSSTGEEMGWSNLMDSTDGGGVATINWLVDSTLVHGVAWSSFGGEPTLSVMKTDRDGNVLKSKFLINQDNYFRDGESTFDNKVVMTVGLAINGIRTYLYKFNSDIEYDSNYSHPFVYDSLCPHPIASDTIPFDCVIVGLDEPPGNFAKTQMRVYPNPASDQLTIDMPEQLHATQKTPLFTINTLHHQWESADLDIFDLSGNLVHNQKVSHREKQVTIKTADWEDGLYIVRLRYKGVEISNVKVLVRH
jgi:hypothetical protein